MPPTADILFKNGNFWTGNPRGLSADYLACKDGRITVMGKEKAPAEGAEDTIDLMGRFAMPGFIDAHTHFRIGGASLNQIDLRNTRNKSEFAEGVRIYVKSHPACKWIVGGNWDHENWHSSNDPVQRTLRADSSLPTKELIDEFTASTPVFLDRIDTHMALVNSRALQLAGISRETPDPPGGVIVRDEHGEPTGIVKDAAREMVWRLVPEPPLEELMRDARAAMKLANSIGVTSVNDIGPERDLKAYTELKKRGELTVRIYMVLPIADYRNLVNQGVQADRHSRSNEWIRLGAVKAFADGSLGAGTAWFFNPYDDDDTNCGIATDIMSSGELEKYATDADRNHVQLAIHAIGDRAVNRVLDIFERIQEENPSWDRRWRLEHAQHVREEDFRRFRELKVIASMQPYHCIDDGRWATRKIGERRTKTTFAFKRMLDGQNTLAFGTDWPVAPLNPLEGIYAAVTRATTDGKNPTGWVPEQKISVEQALRAYTYGSAFASFSEKETGTLEAGKFADIIVLSKSPFEVRPEEIKDIKVVMTVVGGKIVYADQEFSEGSFKQEHRDITTS